MVGILKKQIAMKEPLWGIDLGGTKIEGVILPSLNDPAPILRTRINTEAAKGYPHILHQIDRLVSQMQEQSGLTPKKIGFGTPGVLDPYLLTMKNCTSSSMRFPIAIASNCDIWLRVRRKKPRKIKRR